MRLKRHWRAGGIWELVLTYAYGTPHERSLYELTNFEYVR